MLIHVDDTLPVLTGQIRVGGQPFDLSPGTTSVALKLVGPGDVVVDGAAVKAAGTQGNVSYTWQSGDTETAGVYYGSWIVTTAAGVFTQPGIDVVIYDPDVLWANTAAVEAIIGPQADVEPVIGALVQAQQAIESWVTREIPDPVPDRVRRAHAIMAARVVTGPQFAAGGSTGVIQESVGDHSVRYARPQEAAAVLDPSMHPEVVKLLKPWAPSNYTTFTSDEGGGTGASRAAEERLPASQVDYTSSQTVLSALDDLFDQGIPTGGAQGQVLAKRSGTSYDTEWVTGGGGGGGGERVEYVVVVVPSPVDTTIGGSITGDTLTAAALSSVPVGEDILLTGQTSSADDGIWTHSGGGSFARGDGLASWLAANQADLVVTVTEIGVGTSRVYQVVYDANTDTTSLEPVATDVSALQSSLTTLTNRLNRYYPSTPVVPHLHVSKYVTFDPDFPLDGSATHVGGQVIDDGQNITVMSDDSGNGGVWTLSLTGPATRATGFGAMVSADIGNYDHVSFTGTRWAYFQLFRLIGDATTLGMAPVPPATGITGGLGVSKSYRADLIASSVAGDVFTVLEADGTTTSVDASVDLTGLGTLCILVLSDLTLRTTDTSGAVVAVEDFTRAEGRWTASGVNGDGVGTTVAITDAGSFSVLTGVTPHAASHQDGGSDELALDGSQITTGTVGTARLSLPVRRLAGTGISYTSATDLFGTPPTDIQGNVTTTALAAGRILMTPCDIAGGPTLSTISFEVSASALNAGQSVTIGCYARASTGLPTGTPLWSHSVTVGTTTGTYNVSTTNALPEGGCWLAFLNPSGNAGTVTIYIYQPVSPYLLAFRPVTNRPALISTTGISALPDVSSYTVSNAASASTWGYSQQGTLFMLR